MGVEPEDKFNSEDELKALLERWTTPGPSRVLDKRIERIFWCRQAIRIHRIRAGTASPKARRGSVDEVLFQVPRRVC